LWRQWDEAVGIDDSLWSQTAIEKGEVAAGQPIGRIRGKNLF
jgi:hypothetical protein